MDASVQSAAHSGHPGRKLRLSRDASPPFVLGVLFLRVVGARPVVEDVEKRPTLTVRAATASFSDPFAVPTYSFSIPTYSYSFPTYSFSIPTYSYSFPAYSYSFPTYSYSFPTYSYSAPNYSYSFPTYSYPIPTFDPGTGGSSFTSSARRRTSPRTVIGAVVGSVLGFLSILGGIWAAIKRRARRAMGKPEAGAGEKPPVVAGSNVPPLAYAQPFEQAPLLSSGAPPPPPPPPSQPQRPPEPYVPTAY